MQTAKNKIQLNPCWDNFNEVYLPFIDESSHRFLEVFYGGSSSGKSNFLAHRAILDILKGGHNYLCLRKVSNTVTKSLLNELAKAISDFCVKHLFNVVPSQGHITCVNGYQILFAGLDDPEKVKSITPRKGVLTDVWFEEATEASADDLKQLRKRLRGLAIYKGRRIKKRIILSFNPIYKTHWLYTEYFAPHRWTDDETFYEDNDLRILKTTYKDNKFLTEQDCRLLESEQDPYWYQVYTLGNFGILGDAIFQNWRIKDLSGRHNEFTNIRYGLDFGYSADPASYTQSHIDHRNKKIYILDGFEGTKLTNPELAARLESYVGANALFCDSAEPKSIKELQDNDINAKAVKKGKDSVLHGIQWLQQFEIIIDSKLQHIINEFNTYQWKKDKDGQSLPIPSGADHAIDSLRYATEIETIGIKGLDLS